MRIAIIIILLQLFGANLYAQTILPDYRNPKYNYRLNPYYNKDINPQYNEKINPLKNTIYNPLINNTINPLNNSDISPTNPIFNYNSNIKLNPEKRYGLNPFVGDCDVKFMFDSNAEIYKYLSVVDDSVMLGFDKQGKWDWILIKAHESLKIYNIFELSGSWTGKYLVFDGTEGFNMFDKNGKWTGYFVQ